MVAFTVPAFHAGRIIKDYSTDFLYSLGAFKQSAHSKDLHESLDSFVKKYDAEHKVMYFDSISEKVETLASKTRKTSSIFINPEILKTTPEAAKFLVKRQVYGIQTDFRHMQHKLRAIVSLITALITTFTMSLLGSLAATIVVDKIFHTIFNQYHERKADSFAVKHASNKELIEATIYMRALKELNNLNKKLDSWRSKFIWKGENWLDVANPSIYSKLSKITSELRKRNVDVSEYNPEKMSTEKKSTYSTKVTRLAESLFAAQHKPYAYYLQQVNTQEIVQQALAQTAAPVPTDTPPVEPSAPPEDEAPPAYNPDYHPDQVAPSASPTDQTPTTTEKEPPQEAVDSSSSASDVDDVESNADASSSEASSDIANLQDVSPEKPSKVQELYTGARQKIASLWNSLMHS